MNGAIQMVKHVVIHTFLRLEGSKLKSDSSMSRPGSQVKLGSQRGTPQPADDTQEEPPPREPTPIPRSSVYMQAIDWLLEVKAVPVSPRHTCREDGVPTPVSRFGDAVCRT